MLSGFELCPRWVPLILSWKVMFSVRTTNLIELVEHSSLRHSCFIILRLSGQVLVLCKALKHDFRGVQIVSLIDWKLSDFKVYPGSS